MIDVDVLCLTRPVCLNILSLPKKLCRTFDPLLPIIYYKIIQFCLDGALGSEGYAFRDGKLIKTVLSDESRFTGILIIPFQTINYYCIKVPHCLFRCETTAHMISQPKQVKVKSQLCFSELFLWLSVRTSICLEVEYSLIRLETVGHFA